MLRDLSELIKRRADLLTEARALEYRIEKQRTAALAALPAAFGFPDLGSFIRAVKDAAKRSPKAVRRRSKRVAPTAQAVKVPSVSAAQPPATYPGLAAAKTPEIAKAPLPPGASLDDPANFGVLPDHSVLERGDKSAAAFIDDLSKALRFAEKVLHTSKVPAPIWREWRQFERTAAAAIQTAKDEGRGNSANE